MNLPALDVAASLSKLIQAETDPVARSVLEQAHGQLLCLHQVHGALDGQEYDSDTTYNIQGFLEEAGFVIRDIDDMPDEEE